jgi:hypothetical protein
MPALETPNKFQPPTPIRAEPQERGVYAASPSPANRRINVLRTLPHPRRTVGLRVLNLNVCWCFEFGVSETFHAKSLRTATIPVPCPPGGEGQGEGERSTDSFPNRVPQRTPALRIPHPTDSVDPVNLHFSPQAQNNGALSERGCVVLDQPQRPGEDYKFRRNITEP